MERWTGQSWNETSVGIQTWRKMSAPNLRKGGIEQRESSSRVAWSRGSNGSTDWTGAEGVTEALIGPGPLWGGLLLLFRVWTVSGFKGPHIPSLVLSLVLLGGSRSFRWALGGFNREGGPSRGIVRLTGWTGSSIMLPTMVCSNAVGMEPLITARHLHSEEPTQTLPLFKLIDFRPSLQ